MQWYPEQCSLWCTAALANLHLICMLFVWGPAQPRGTWSLHRGGGRRGRGHILYTPHGHTDSRSPGGGAGRVRSSTTKKGVSHGHSAGTRDDFLPVAAGAGQHEMWSVCIADVGRGQDLVPVWHLVRAVAILCLPCMLRLSYSGTLCALFCQLIDVFMLLCQATNSLNRGPSTISK